MGRGCIMILSMFLLLHSPTRLLAYTYLGCYADSKVEELSERALNIFRYDDKSMTLDKCKNYAILQNSKLFSIQGGTTCFLGDNLDRAKGWGETSNCDIPCYGGGSEACGGYWANSLYANDFDINSKRALAANVWNETHVAMFCETIFVTTGTNFLNNQCIANQSIQYQYPCHHDSECYTWYNNPKFTNISGKYVQYYKGFVDPETNQSVIIRSTSAPLNGDLNELCPTENVNHSEIVALDSCSRGRKWTRNLLPINETAELQFFFNPDCAGEPFPLYRYTMNTCFGDGGIFIKIENDVLGSVNIILFFTGTGCGDSIVSLTVPWYIARRYCYPFGAFGVQGAVILRAPFPILRVPYNPGIGVVVVIGIVVAAMGASTVASLPSLLSNLDQAFSAIKCIQEFIQKRPSLFLTTTSGVLSYIVQWLYFLTSGYYFSVFYFLSLLCFFFPAVTFTLLVRKYSGKLGYKKLLIIPFVSQIFVNFGYSIFPRISDRFHQLLNSPESLGDSYHAFYFNAALISGFICGTLPQFVLLMVNEVFCYEEGPLFTNGLAILNLICTLASIVTAIFSIIKLVSRKKNGTPFLFSSILEEDPIDKSKIINTHGILPFEDNNI